MFVSNVEKFSHIYINLCHRMRRQTPPQLNKHVEVQIVGFEETTHSGEKSNKFYQCDNAASPLSQNAEVYIEGWMTTDDY